MQGLVHSIDTFSTVDGPGIRTVIFLQGCHLRCKYCHNPDAWNLKSQQAKEYSVEEILQIVLRSQPYFKASKGGVTLSGGEPLLQHEFVREIFKECKKYDIHTALDTSLYVKTSFLDAVMPFTDLFLADIKHINPSKSKDLTSMSNELNLANLKYISEAHIPIWIRHVIVPGFTDSRDDLTEMGHLIKELESVERIDLLPYHTLGKHKWELLGLNYELNDINPPSLEKIEEIQNMLREITNVEVYANV